MNPPAPGVRFVAEHLVTAADSAVHTPGVVDVTDGTVAWAGAAGEAPASDAPVTRLDGLVIPGLVNTHAHTPMLLLRGTGEGLPTDRWLTEVMWPREGRLVADDVAWAMRLGACELLCNGITTTSEMYFFADELARSAVEAGLRAVVAVPLIEAADLSRFGSITEQLDQIGELRSRWAGDPLVEISVGPHAAYSLSREALAAVAERAAAEPMLVHTHVAEQPHEGDAVTAATGLTVPAYLDAIGLLGPRTLAAHCVWMTPADIDLFAERGVAVAHCPASNGRHASGIAPLQAMRSAGITVGLGTDGPASHDRLDLFAEMRTATWFARIRDHDASQLSAAEAFAMATTDAGRAIGRPELGRIEAGAPADLVRIDVSGPAFDPVLEAEQLVERLVWAGAPGLVRDVWVGGRQVVREAECITIDRAEARREVTARARRLVDG